MNFLKWVFPNLATDEELDDEREIARKASIDGSNPKWAEALRERDYLDKEINRRSAEKYRKENPNPKPPRHREHGWYLSNDD